MYDFNKYMSFNKQSQNNLKYMMIENDNYEDGKSNHLAGFIITLLIIAPIVIFKWLLGE